jgi:hypothetical protein
MWVMVVGGVIPHVTLPADLWDIFNDGVPVISPTILVTVNIQVCDVDCVGHGLIMAKRKAYTVRET